MKDIHSKFSPITISLHWIIALSIIIMLVFGLYLEELPRSPEKGALMGLHKSFGTIILLLAVIRIYWRIKNGFPKPLSQGPNWQMTLAKFTHWVLITGTVFMPLSGIFMSVGGGYGLAVFGIQVIPKIEAIEILGQIGGAIHGIGSKLLILFIVLHIFGAIKHQFIDKDGTIARMLGSKID
ncbi:cytochrome b [Marinagarivorans algicola]|nr:cytochrome b [Marinagarivorans algicola]